MKNKWDRRDSKRISKRKFKSDNRKSVRGISVILKSKADQVKKEKEDIHE